MYTNFKLVLILLSCVSIAHQELSELKQVPPRSFPYVADIESHEWCHGVLITKNYVLTNARCVANSPNRIYIYLGWYSYPEYKNPVYKSDIQIYSSSNVIHHPDYEEIQKYWNYRNDIALVKLIKTISVTEAVKPARLADPNTFRDTELAGQYGLVFGWWPISNLSAATVQVKSHQECKEDFGGTYFEDRQFCVKWPKGERLCSHHSLPMEIDGRLIGFMIDDYQNTGDCMEFKYKFINILYYYDWILKNSDLGEYIKSSVKELPLSDTYTPAKKRCKVDLELACPKNKES